MCHLKRNNQSNQFLGVLGDGQRFSNWLSSQEATAITPTIAKMNKIPCIIKHFSPRYSNKLSMKTVLTILLSVLSLKRQREQKTLVSKRKRKEKSPLWKNYSLIATTTDSWKHATVFVRTLFEEALLVCLLFDCGKNKTHLLEAGGSCLTTIPPLMASRTPSSYLHVTNLSIAWRNRVKIQLCKIISNHSSNSSKDFLLGKNS